MNTKQQAFEDLKFIAERFPALLALGKELAEVGSMDQAANEAKSRLAAAQAEEAAIRGRIADVLKQIEDAKQEADGHRAKGRQDADDIRDAAAKEVSRTHSVATIQAAQIVADAQAEADRIKSDHEAIRGELEDYKTQIAHERRTLAGIHTEIAAKRALHGEVSEQLRALKGKL